MLRSAILPSMMALVSTRMLPFREEPEDLTLSVLPVQLLPLDVTLALLTAEPR